MSKRKPANIAEQLRRAMADSGQSLYALAKGSGIDYAALFRFDREQRSLNLDSAARLAAYLGLELRPVSGK